MIIKLISNSFRRDFRKKAVAMAAVMLATCLAAFLLNWSLNLGDKIQRDLRAYGANILIVPSGESLPVGAGNIELGTFDSGNYLKYEEMKGLGDIFWTNQLLAYTPMLPVMSRINGKEVTLVGTEFGENNAAMNLQKAAPYLSLNGKWPGEPDEVVAGSALAAEFHWKTGSQMRLVSSNQEKMFRISGIVHSGGSEDRELFTKLSVAQALIGNPGAFKQLLVSAMVSPTNPLYLKYQQNPKSLTSQETERYYCTPYITSVASDITKVFTGSEARILRQISQTEEKITHKVNWLMALVTLAALVASSLTMTSTTTGMILERRKELALMKAIGSHNAFILFYLLSEMFLLGIVGSLAGYALGSFLSVSLSRSVFESMFELKPIVLPLVGLIGLLIVLCGSILPLRRATLLQPSQALKDL